MWNCRTRSLPYCLDALSPPLQHGGGAFGVVSWALWRSRASSSCEPRHSIGLIQKETLEFSMQRSFPWASHSPRFGRFVSSWWELFHGGGEFEGSVRTQQSHKALERAGLSRWVWPWSFWFAHIS